MGWENKTLSQIKEVLPNHEKIYRPKPGHDERLKDCKTAPSGNIASVIKGASLVVCHHSNVAIDCCILGVPCVCFGGVGRYLWASEIRPGASVPTEAQRWRFLTKSSWLNWSLEEPEQIINFIQDFSVNL